MPAEETVAGTFGVFMHSVGENLNHHSFSQSKLNTVDVVDELTAEMIPSQSTTNTHESTLLAVDTELQLRQRKPAPTRFGHLNISKNVGKATR